MATAAAFPNSDLELGRPGGHRPLNEDYDPSASRLFGGDELADNMNFNAVARESGFWQGTNSGDGYSAWDKLWHNSTVVPVTAIPEPTAVGLFATAMLGLGRWRRGFAAR